MDNLSLPFFKWLVLNNGQLEFTFCQVVSPKQWTA